MRHAPPTDNPRHLRVSGSAFLPLNFHLPLVPEMVRHNKKTHQKKGLLVCIDDTATAHTSLPTIFVDLALT